MGRRWVPFVIVVFGGLLGLAIAGFPSRSHDPAITVRAEPATTTTSAPRAATSTVVTSPPTSLRPAADVRVVVFNASDTAGAATRVSNRVKAEGWNVKVPGPDRKGQAATVVMYRPEFDDEARSLAASLDVGAGAAAPFDASIPLGDADIAVLVGDDLAKRP